jgi:hypothetical protein
LCSKCVSKSILLLAFIESISLHTYMHHLYSALTTKASCRDELKIVFITNSVWWGGISFHGVLLFLLSLGDTPLLYFLIATLKGILAIFRASNKHSLLMLYSFSLMTVLVLFLSFTTSFFALPRWFYHNTISYECCLQLPRSRDLVLIKYMFSFSFWYNMITLISAIVIRCFNCVTGFAFPVFNVRFPQS